VDRKIAIEHLAVAEATVALGLKHIVDQEARIRQLTGRDRAHAERLLTAFRESQVLHEEHRDRLRRRLGIPD